jgi:hypothetical protein
MKKMMLLALAMVMLTFVCGVQMPKAQNEWVFTGTTRFFMTFTGEDKTNPAYPLTGFKKLVNYSIPFEGTIVMTQPLADNGSGVMVPSTLASVSVSLTEVVSDPEANPLLINIDITGPDFVDSYGMAINSRGNGLSTDKVHWRYNCKMVLVGSILDGSDTTSRETRNTTLVLTGTRPRMKSTESKPVGPTGIYKIILAASTLGGGIRIEDDKYLFKGTFSSVLTRPLP